ncbi:hypothetical protein SAVIM338S_02801 [Streptomyces avidinii]
MIHSPCPLSAGGVRIGLEFDFDFTFGFECEVRVKYVRAGGGRFV